MSLAVMEQPRSRLLLWLAMPMLGVANQYLAERLAHALDGIAFGPAWLTAALHSPWLIAWAGLEVVALFAWMAVLAELSLSAAFPMTAAGYVLVIAMGWTVLHEPVSPLQLIGGASILAGVWLLGSGKAER